MTLSPLSRFGAYEIVSLIGRGGIGEVYRARDTRLGRDVALKVLREAEAAHPTWRVRFEREARALASLNHLNIAAIYGLEENAPTHSGSAPTTAIIMELVDGETLADRLTRGALPLDEALNVAGQMADALAAAHEKGIVHRDLKPANVKITPTGTVKVLDFGIAKILADPVGDAVTVSTVTAPKVLLGTPAYMAPEQAEGGSADTRADVWAFGVVLYEMMTGERPFRRESLQDTLAAIRTADLRWERVPLAVRPLLRACLERDPRKRLRDIGDYRFLLTSSQSTPAAPGRLPVRTLLAGLTALALIVLAFLAGQSLTQDNDTSAPTSPIRLSTMLPVGVSVTRGPGYTSSVAVSPDGRTAVIAASDKDGQRLYRRPLDRLDPIPLAGTDRGSSPFFSWDGKSIGFFADGRLKRIPADGGVPVDIAEAPGFSSGASWGPDDRIVFAYGADAHLHVVPAQGGNIEALTNKVPGRQPEVLPDGQTVLFESEGYIHAFARRTGAITKLLPGAAPRYADGHVIFSRGTTLFAARINLADASTGPRLRSQKVSRWNYRAAEEAATMRFRAAARSSTCRPRRRTSWSSSVRTASSVLSGNRSARWKTQGSRPMVATSWWPPGAATTNRRIYGCTTWAPVQPLVSRPAAGGHPSGAVTARPSPTHISARRRGFIPRLWMAALTERSCWR
jgi:serine/threonine protein kinase